MAIICTSLTVQTQPSPRFYVKSVVTFQELWNGLLFVLTNICLNQAIRATVVALDKSYGKEWARLTVNVNRPFKRSFLKLKRGDYHVWMRLKDFRCKCPKIKVGRGYFIAGSISTNRNKSELRVDRRSIVIPWQERLVKKISKFLRRERRRKCSKRHWY